MPVATYVRTKDLQISKLLLVTNSGTIDIREKMVEVHLFESVFENFMTATISMIDGTALDEIQPIVGDERLIIVFRTSIQGPYETWSKEFNIFSIKDEVVVNGKRTKYYSLHFFSEKYEKNQTIKIQRPYHEMTEDLIVSDIASNLLGIELTTNEACKYPRSIVVPNWRPLYTINDLAKNAVRATGYESTNFIFYENLDGFHWVSLDQLMEQPNAFEFTHALSRVDAKDVASILNVAEYQVVENFNEIRNLQTGQWFTQFIGHDIIRKKVEKWDYDYSAEFPGQVKIDGDNVELRRKYPRGIDQLTHFEPRQLTEEPRQYDSRWFDKNVIKRCGMMSQWENYRLECKMEGDSNLRAGMKIKFKIPSTRMTLDGSLDVPDEKLSGSYIITSINHTINQSEHLTNLELRKPAVRKN